MEHDPQQEQLRYAKLLHWSTLAGFVSLIASFFLYVFQILPSKVPLQALPGLWNQSADDYLRLTRMPTGWHWLTELSDGHLANFLGIAILCGCSIVCILAVIPIYARRRDKLYFFICAAEIAVLILAASGILGRGH